MVHSWFRDEGGLDRRCRGSLRRGATAVRRRAVCALAAAPVIGVLIACTGGTSEPSASVSPTASTPARTVGGDPWDCHVGTFRVTGIQARRDTSTPLGEIRVAAAPGVLTLTTRPDGTWSVVADPIKPITLQSGNVSGEVTADGQVEGTYRRTGDTADFAVTDVAGGVTSRLGDVRRTDPLDRFAPAIAPSGSTTVACGPSNLLLGSAAIRLTLSRVPGDGSPSAIPTPSAPSR